MPSSLAGSRSTVEVKRLAERGWLVPLRSSEGFVVLAISAGIFTDVFTYGLLVPILPYTLFDMAELPQDQVQMWVGILLGTYGAANGLSSPLLGLLADRGTTRRGSYIGSVMLLILSLAVFWTSNSLASVVAARIFQGISAAGVWTVGLAMIVDAVSSDRLHSAMGYVSLAMTIGNVLGPLVGGILFDLWGFHVVLAIAVGFAVLDILLRLVMIETTPLRSRSETEPVLRNGGSTTYDTFSRIASFAGYKDPEEESLSSAADELSSITEGDIDKSGPSPLAVFKSGSFLSILLGVAVSSSFYSAFDSILPLHVLKTFGWASVGGGLVFLPLALPCMLAPLFGATFDKYNGQSIPAGAFAVAMPFYILLRFADSDDLTSRICLCCLLAIIGATLTAQMVPLMAEVSRVLESPADSQRLSSAGRLAFAYGLFNLAYAGGICAGALVAGNAMDTLGWPLTTLILGLMSGVTAFVIWYAARTSRRQPTEHEERA